MRSAEPPPVAPLLRQWRRAAALTQEQLAERAGMSVETVSALERGLSRAPYRATITALADALGLDREGRARLLAAARPETASPVPLATGQRADPAPAHPSPPPPAPGALAPVATGEQRAPLLGRTTDLAVLHQLLLAGTTRLLTLVGPAGVGKTSLALEVGRALESHFADGLVFVDLTTVRDPDNVRRLVGQRLGFKDLESCRLLERIQAYLADRDVLLILDNAEHVLATVQELAERLIATARLTVLATSREPLHLRAERVYHLPPLALPDPHHLPPLEELARCPAVALFLRRAQAINLHFTLDGQQAQAVAELVVRLDGLPLAIELAAARTSFLTPQMILARLGQRLSLLGWRAPDLPERQQRLRSAIAWSYDLLTAEEQALFRHLGVFAASFSLPAAEAIAAPLAVDGLEALASLVEKNLIQLQDRDPEELRYVLLESMREFARERLTEAGELEAAGASHARYYLGLAEHAAPELRGREQRRWFERLEGAHENLRAALRWLLRQEQGEHALRLATALGYFWEVRGYTAEGRRWLAEAVARAPKADPGLRARGLSWLGFLLIWSADEPEQPRAVLTEALALARAVHEGETIARSLMHLGVLAHLTKQWDQSGRALDEALTYWRAAGNSWGIASTLLYRGGIALRQEHYREATRLLEESLALFRAMHEESALVWVLFSLAYTAGEQGQLPGAVRYLRELLALSTQTQNRRQLYLCGLGVLWRLREQGEAEQLARLVGALHQVREVMGIGWGKIVAAAIPFLPSAAQALRTRLGPDAFEAALAEGRSLSFPQVTGLIADVLDAAAEGDASEHATYGEGATSVNPSLR